jgi:hypothetical protein
MGYANPLQKTHKIEFETRQVCYPWHRWYGRSVLTRRAGGAHSDVAYFCKLPEALLHELLVEVPKWMFDTAECARMRIADVPHVDCVTLRALRRTIAEQRAFLTAAVIQPQLSRHAGHGGTDDSDSKNRSNNPDEVVQPTPSLAALERSHPAHARRGSQASGATVVRRLDKRSSSSFSKARWA